MAIQFRQPGEIRVPSNFIGDTRYFGSPEYFEFINANAGVPRTADLSYTSPYFRGGLSSSFGASQDAAIKKYLDRVQAESTAGGAIIPERAPDNMIAIEDPEFFRRAAEEVRRVSNIYSNPINFLPSEPITPGEPDPKASQIDASIRPFLTEGLRQAQEIFLRQQPQFFPGQTYVSPSQQTLQALQQQENIARAGSPILGEAQGAFLRGLTAPSAATPLYQSIFGAAGMQPGADVFGQAAQGGMPIAGQAQLQNLYGAAGAQPGQNVFGAAAGGQFQNIATGQLANIAGGGFLQGSPYQQAMMEAATRPLVQQFGQQVLPGISSLYSKSGRLGSGAMERALGTATEQYGRALGDVTANLAGTQYQQERALQQQALGQLAGVSAQDIQTRLAGAGALEQAQRAAIGQQAGIAGQLAGLSAQDIQTRLAGAQGLQQAQQAALGTQLQAAGGVGTGQYQELTRQLGAAQAAPQIYSQQFLPAQTLAQVGAQREAIAAQPLQEEMARFGFQQRLPYEQLSGYLSSVYGSPLGSYGTPAPQPQYAGNRTVGALGGALAGGLGGYALGQAFPSLSFGGGFGLPAIGAIGGGLLGGGFF